MNSTLTSSQNTGKDPTIQITTKTITFSIQITEKSLLPDKPSSTKPLPSMLKNLPLGREWEQETTVDLPLKSPP